MILKRLELHNFRLYKKRVFEFTEGVNAIYGQNGKGKTTLLEAIYALICGRSFRSSKLQELICHGAAYFRVEAHFEKFGVEQKLALWSDGKQRRLFYNGTPMRGPTAFLGIILGGLLTPDDISLVKGAPAVRRLFLDIQLAQSNPLYVHYLIRYNKAVQQRNILLRNKSEAAISLWEQQIADAGSYLIQQRRIITEELQKQVTALLKEQSWQIKYCTSIPPHIIELDEVASNLYALFAAYRKKELALGYTLVGVHRDDLLFSYEDKPLRNFASEGQQRAAVATLRLAEWHVLKNLTEQNPLMLLDDSWQGLDLRKRKEQAFHLQSLGQVFFTATEMAPFLESNEIYLE